MSSNGEANAVVLNREIALQMEQMFTRGWPTPS
ncbi:hypothetical protein KP001_08015 [Geomonas subterranea]|uniref:Uncharacterized protein n=2 Tax=Geomonas subterranea TaxID=2847989 RepID=A0ABX8LNF9_9BACT|nr:hypothetical protein KP001_08015 [Geomonas subterranea]QXM09444.1 hypothetical protein KP002_21255 [Geomonas subterranea]